MPNTFKSNPIEFKPAAALPAPKSTVGFIAWVRANLFSSIPNTLITLFIAFVLVRLIPGVIDWMFILYGSGVEICTLKKMKYIRTVIFTP